MLKGYFVSRKVYFFRGIGRKTMKKEFVEDLIFGARLLICEDADKSELEDNIRCARVLLNSFPEM